MATQQRSSRNWQRHCRNSFLIVKNYTDRDKYPEEGYFMFSDIKQVSEKISHYIRSGVQCIQLVTGGQGHAAVEMLKEIAGQQGLDYISWDPAKGFGDNEFINPVRALEAIVSGVPPISQRNAIIVMHELHYDLNAIPSLVATLKLSICANQFNPPAYHRPVFLLTTNPGMNPDILPYIKLIEMTHPSRDQLNRAFEVVQASIPTVSKREVSEELKYRLVTALAGLTCPDAESVLAEALVRHGRWSDKMIDTIEEEKGLLLRKSEVLTYVSKAEVMNSAELGGYVDMKAWLNERKVAYEPEAEELNLDKPKGAVLVGVPGTGKSMCALAIAKVLGLPLIKMDIGAVFSSLVGESERKIREAIGTADAMGGCVLLIDEADKVLGGAHEASGDSGVTRRVFGQILTWWAAKKTKTFVVLTMNRITGMPPELLRRGRFDEIFFVDTPDERERRQIFEIHMANRGIPIDLFSDKEWSKVIDSSEGFVGAEIEQAIVASRFAAYANDKSSRGIFTADQLNASLKELVPVTKIDPENIEQIRAFGRDRARSVSGRRANAVKQHARAMDLSFNDPNLS